MRFPCSTGEAASLLGTTEPRLAETVRRLRVEPPPPIIAGRRLWERTHLLQAARALGIAAEDLPQELQDVPSELAGGVR